MSPSRAGAARERLPEAGVMPHVQVWTAPTPLLEVEAVHAPARGQRGVAVCDVRNVGKLAPHLEQTALDDAADRVEGPEGVGPLRSPLLPSAADPGSAVVVGHPRLRYNGGMSAPSSGYLNVYLLDDHDIVRQGIRDLLVPARDIRVVGDSGSARSAPDSILRLATDVMVLDLQLQDGSGVHVCRRVRAVDPSVQGLLVTSSDDDEALAAAVLAGAAGFVVKLAHSNDILGAIRRLGAGRALMDQALAARAATILNARAEALVPPLTDRERELLDGVLAGRTDQEIAEDVHEELTAAQADVGSLVDRLMTHAWGTALNSGGPVGGKHRRTM